MQAASLYKHYPTKDDVLDDIARGVIGRVDTSAFNEGADWQQALASWARSYRDALAAHPNLVPYLAEGPGQREEGMQLANAVHGGLVRAGWPPREATLIGAATRHLVLGSTVGSFSRGFVDDVQVYRDRYPTDDGCVGGPLRRSGASTSPRNGTYRVNIDVCRIRQRR